MKALELADKLATLDNFYFEESSRYDEFACQVVGDAGHELRRLAGVNADLMDVLNRLIIADEHQALDNAMFAYAKKFLAKAKEQQ